VSVVPDELKELWLANTPTESFRKKLEEIIDKLNREGRGE